MQEYVNMLIVLCFYAMYINLLPLHRFGEAVLL